MLSRRLLPLAVLPMAALPRAAGVANPAANAGPDGRNCGDPGGRFIACEAMQATLAPTMGAGCPICGGRHRLAQGRQGEALPSHIPVPR